VRSVTAPPPALVAARKRHSPGAAGPLGRRRQVPAAGAAPVASGSRAPWGGPRKRPHRTQECVLILRFAVAPRGPCGRGPRRGSRTGIRAGVSGAGQKPGKPNSALGFAPTRRRLRVRQAARASWKRTLRRSFALAPINQSIKKRLKKLVEVRDVRDENKIIIRG
jgi:hypothetical protein